MNSFFSAPDLAAFTSTHLDPRFYSSHAPSSPAASSSSIPFPTSPSVCGSSSSRSSGGRNRVNLACSYCRTRKIKCDGGVTCSNCRRTKRCCVYTEVSDDANRAAKERKAYLKSLKANSQSPSRQEQRPYRAIVESSSCPELLLEGWSPKKSPSSSSYPSSPSTSRPFPSVLLSSPLVSLSPSPNSSTYSPSASSSSAAQFMTPPHSPAYRHQSSFNTPYLVPAPHQQPFDAYGPPPPMYAPQPFDMPATAPNSEEGGDGQGEGQGGAMFGLGFSFTQQTITTMSSPTEGEGESPAVWLDFDNEEGGAAEWVVAGGFGGGGGDGEEDQQMMMCGAEWGVPSQGGELSSFWVPSIY